MKTIKNNKISVMLGLICLAFTSTVNAAAAAKKEDDKFPIGCLDVGYKKEFHILELLPGEVGGRNSMYLVFNRSPQTVNLYQMLDQGNIFGVHLNHSINSRQWGVFSTNEKRVKFICTVPDRRFDSGRIVDCKNMVAVCEYTKVRFGMNNRGNFWLLNSNSKNSAVNSIVHYGIIPGN